MRKSHYPKHSLVREARQLWDDGKITDEVYQSYRSQINNAIRRGIDFQIPFHEWWNWWQVDSRWHHRGVGSNKLVMARIGDIGPYHLDNIYCATQNENSSDKDGSSISKAHKSIWAAKTPEQRAKWHLAVRGDGHPKSRAVISPAGERFGSAALAAEAFGVTRQCVACWCRMGHMGWRYEKDAGTA